jgi:hypothetical protein
MGEPQEVGAPVPRRVRAGDGAGAMHHQVVRPHAVGLADSPGGSAMNEHESKSQHFVALCMLGMVLFNYPVLALFNVSGTLLGVPVLYAYLFIAWAAMIALMAYLAESMD